MWKEMTKNQKAIISVLVLINLLNYMDRQIIFPLFHHIQKDFGISDFQLGLLGTVFVVAFSIATIPMGMLADAFSRRLVIFWGVLFWSFSTFLSGLAQGFKSLLAVRSLVGLGEASYAPAATAMIGDNFPEDKRARVQGLFYVGTFLGGAIGAVIGATIVSYTDSWRLAFFIVSIPGFVLAAASFFLKDKHEEHKEREKLRISKILHNKKFVLILLSGIFAAYTTNAYISWGVEYVRRFTSFGLLDGTLVLGTAAMIAGIVGVVAGGYVADHLQKKSPAGRSLAVALALIASTPFLLLGFWFHENNFLLMSMFGIGIALMSFYFGPVIAVIQDVVPKHLRATAFAVYIFTIQLIGGSTAPSVTGWLSDVYDLNIALMISTSGELISGIIFLIISKIIIDEYKQKEIPA